MLLESSETYLLVIGISSFKRPSYIFYNAEFNLFLIELKMKDGVMRPSL